MIMVRGRAITQKSHCVSSMLRTSLVFMPRMEATVLRGRNMMVTIVKAYTAVSCLSLFVSMLRRF